ncbi:hypothetical protein DB32_000553 [Sandaracinus amylolyticus]|uniref:Uncharacterized protein n=1 Tax=Sandaracinus amylolyticus TaxID=927083 RepID=A0A0F6SDG5_9BACT|nr:hypothetical protein DB32_000553 [Sandaracinus amylolyticus]
MLGRMPESGREARLWKIWMKQLWKRLSQLEENSSPAEDDDADS